MENVTPLRCSVCLEYFNSDNRTPKALSCGHLLCLSCVDKLLNNCKTQEHPSCPECRVIIRVTNSSQLPTIFQILRSMPKENASFPTSIDLLRETDSRTINMFSYDNVYVGVCRRHSNSMRNFACTFCREWLCATCVLKTHLSKLECEIKTAFDALKYLKESYSKTLKSLINEVNDKYKNNDLTKEDFEILFQELQNLESLMQKGNVSAEELEDFGETLHFAKEKLKRTLRTSY